MMNEENEDLVLEHDWLVAQFTVESGALLAGLIGLLIAALADQVPWLVAGAFMVFGSGTLFYLWTRATRESEELRAMLKARKASEQR